MKRGLAGGLIRYALQRCYKLFLPARVYVRSFIEQLVYGLYRVKNENGLPKNFQVHDVRILKHTEDCQHILQKRGATTDRISCTSRDKLSILSLAWGHRASCR